MAQQATRKQPETAASRPRSPRLSKGPGPKTWDYTRPRMTISSPDDFMDYMKAYPNPEGITLFLYRLVPKIDLSLIGLQESNIQKGPYEDLALFSLEAVAERFRNGKYNIRVTDSNRAEGQREVVKSCQYKITEAGPPVYDVRTLQIGHTDSIDEVTRLLNAGVLVRDSSGAPRLRTEADAPPSLPQSPAVPAVPGLGNDLVGKVVMGLLERASSSPRDTIQQSIEVARMLTPPPPPIDVEAAVERALTRLGVKPNAGTLESELATYERVERLANRFRQSGAAATPVNAVVEESWAPHLNGILTNIRGMIPELVDAFKQLRGFTGAGKAATVEHPQPQGQPMTIEQRIEEVFTLGFHQMNQGTSGFDFAAWVCYHYPGGAEVYRHLEPHGSVGVMALLAMNPQARAYTTDPNVRPKLEKFLDEFFEFEPGVMTEPGQAAAAGAGAN